MNKSAKSNDTLGRQWPGVDLLLLYDPKYVIYLVASVVAIVAVLITIVTNKAVVCVKIGKVIPNNMFYIMFGSLCALIEFYVTSNQLINPAEVIITAVLPCNIQYNSVLFSSRSFSPAIP